MKKYTEMELIPGINLEQAVSELLKYKEKGELASVKFNNEMLYSDTVTMNSAYLQVLGMTKTAFDARYPETKQSKYRWSLLYSERMFLIGLLATLKDDGEIEITEPEEKQKIKELLQSLKETSE